jgi:hypothetical protein
VDRRQFFRKPAAYQVFFSTERGNRSRDKRTPLELMEELAAQL